MVFSNASVLSHITFYEGCLGHVVPRNDASPGTSVGTTDALLGMRQRRAFTFLCMSGVRSTAAVSTSERRQASRSERSLSGARAGISGSETRNTNHGTPRSETPPCVHRYLRAYSCVQM